LAKAYSALRALLPTAQRAALLYSQREWIAPRDGGCQGKREPNGDGRAPAANHRDLTHLGGQPKTSLALSLR
jgi:uncharacterized protein YecT (DUF1311 family)